MAGNMLGKLENAFKDVFRLPRDRVHYELLDHIKRERLKGKLLAPYYGKYSIAEIVPTILQIFGVNEGRATFPFEIVKGRKYNRVILLVIDGLSFHHFAKYQQRFKFFDLLSKKGDVFPITSVFPSTTPAALTTIHTGLTPQEHGLPEWNVYFEEFDQIIETLPFKTPEMSNIDELVNFGGSHEMLYEGPTIYSKLKEYGIVSYTFTNALYSESVYSTTVHFGSETIPCLSGEDFIEKVAGLLNINTAPGYYLLYWAGVDSAAHAFGPDSQDHLTSLEYISSLMQMFLGRLEKTKINDTLFLITADHGQVSIRGEDIINLNKYQILEENFQENKRGQRILPTGSPHDVFLFIRPEQVEAVVDFLRGELSKHAEVFTIQEAIDKGLFGINKPRQRFLKRVGTVLVIPKQGYHIWYEFLPEVPYRQLGVHGGLSEDEMIVPFAFAPLSSLVRGLLE